MWSKEAPLKSATGETTKDIGKQLERWVEHYFDLYSWENTISDITLNLIKWFPIMAKLDKMSTIQKLSKAINCLQLGRPWTRCRGSDAEEALLDLMYDLLCQVHCSCLLAFILKENQV